MKAEEIKEISIYEDTDYFKFQHGGFFDINGERKEDKNQGKGTNEEPIDNINDTENFLFNCLNHNNFTISNVNEKGLYIINDNLNIFELPDFLYKLDTRKNEIKIKSIPFKESVLLLVNDKKDEKVYIYTKENKLYLFNFAKDELSFYFQLDISIKQLKPLSDNKLLLLSEEGRLYYLLNKKIYEFDSEQFPNFISCMDEKNGVFLFSFLNNESFVLKEEMNSNYYDLKDISEEIDIIYEFCNIICCKILETEGNKRKLFIVVLYNSDEELTSVTYDLLIENETIKTVNYSINDFPFENGNSNNWIKTVYMSEWKILLAYSSESYEVVSYTLNPKFEEGQDTDMPPTEEEQREFDTEKVDLKMLSIKEGYKINTREAESSFLSLFVYTKYIDKLYRKSKLFNIPVLKNPVVFFLLQNNLKIVIEYLDQYKLEDNHDYSFSEEQTEETDHNISEKTIFNPLKKNLVEEYKEMNYDLLSIFKWKLKQGQVVIGQMKVQQQDTFIKEYYSQLSARENIAQENIAQEDIAQEDIAHEDITQEDISQEDISQEDISQEDIAQEDIAQEDIAQEDIAQEDIAQEDIAQEDIAQEDIAQEDIAQENIFKEKIYVENVFEENVFEETISKKKNSEEIVLKETAYEEKALSHTEKSIFETSSKPLFLGRKIPEFNSFEQFKTKFFENKNESFRIQMEDYSFIKTDGYEGIAMKNFFIKNYEAQKHKEAEEEEKEKEKEEKEKGKDDENKELIQKEQVLYEEKVDFFFNSTTFTKNITAVTEEKSSPFDNNAAAPFDKKETPLFLVERITSGGGDGDTQLVDPFRIADMNDDNPCNNNYADYVSLFGENILFEKKGQLIGNVLGKVKKEWEESQWQKLRDEEMEKKKKEKVKENDLMYDYEQQKLQQLADERRSVEQRMIKHNIEQRKVEEEMLFKKIEDEHKSMEEKVNEYISLTEIEGNKATKFVQAQMYKNMTSEHFNTFIQKESYVKEKVSFLEMEHEYMKKRENVRDEETEKKNIELREKNETCLREELREKFKELLKGSMYEDTSVIAQSMPPAFQHCMRSGMFFSEEFLKEESVNLIEHKKLAFFTEKQEDMNKKVKNLFLLNKDEKHMKAHNDTSCEQFMHLHDFEPNEEERIEEFQCESIIKKLKKKRNFLFYASDVLQNKNEEKMEEWEYFRNDKSNISYTNIIEKRYSGNGNCNNYVSNEGINNNDDFNKTDFSKADRNKKKKKKHFLETQITTDCFQKFYEKLNRIFSKRNVICVKTELLENPEMQNQEIRHFFQLLLFNIFKKGEYKLCEQLIYFILKNSKSSCFLNSLYLLEHYFLNVFKEGLKKADPVADLTADVSDDAKGFCTDGYISCATNKASFVDASNTGFCRGENKKQSNRDRNLNQKMEKKEKENERKTNKAKAKAKGKDEGSSNMDNKNGKKENETEVEIEKIKESEYKSNESIYGKETKKRKNILYEKDLFIYVTRRTPNERKDIINVLNYGINFISQYIESYFSQHFLTMLFENDMQKMMNHLNRSRLTLLNIQLNNRETKQIIRGEPF